MYEIRFWFEHGGPCLWSLNRETKDKYGYPISKLELPLSESTLIKLNCLKEEYHSYLNWDAPASPSAWSEDHKKDFIVRGNDVYSILVKELGDVFQVRNEITSSVHFNQELDEYSSSNNPSNTNSNAQPNGRVEEGKMKETV